MAESAAARLVIRLSNYFVSDRLLDDTLVDARQRAPIFIAVLLSSSVSALLMLIALGTLYAISGQPLHLLALAMAVLTLFGYVTTLWHFKRHQALLSSADLYALTTTFATVAPCTITGGMSNSPYVSLILVVPVFLFLMSGRKQGLYWTVATVACVAVLSISEFLGMEFPQAIAAPYMAGFTLVAWLTTVGLLILGLDSYETNVEALKNRVAADEQTPVDEGYRQSSFAKHNAVNSSNETSPPKPAKNIVTFRQK